MRDLGAKQLCKKVGRFVPQGLAKIRNFCCVNSQHRFGLVEVSGRNMIVTGKLRLRCQFACICSHERSFISQLNQRFVRHKHAAKDHQRTWEQIYTAYAAGVGLREIARKMNIPEVTVLQHAHRHSWTQQIKNATGEVHTASSNVIAPLSSGVIAPVHSVQSVPQSVASILSERKERTKLGLSKFTAEAAEQAGEHCDKLGIAGKELQQIPSQS